MSLIIHIPDPPKPRDDWSGAYLVQSKQVTDLYARAIEQMIDNRGGWLYAADGKRERATVMGIHIDERA